MKGNDRKPWACIQTFRTVTNRPGCMSISSVPAIITMCTHFVMTSTGRLTSQSLSADQSFRTGSVYVYIYIYIYTCIGVYMYVYIYIYIYIYAIMNIIISSI